MNNVTYDSGEKKKWCEQNMHRYVLAQTHDGWCCDGFIEYVDDESVSLAVPYGSNEWDNRAFIPFGGPLYPYPYFPRRRFYRRTFPLAALLTLSLLPFF